MAMANRIQNDTEMEPPKPSRQDDNLEKRWLAAVAGGDKSAFEALYRCYFPRLLRFCHRLSNQLEGLDEIVNDVMLVVWNRAASYDQKCRPSTWIFGIAYRKTLDSQRRRRKDHLLDPLDAHPDLPQPSSYAHHETRDWLHAGFQELSIDHRTVLELTYQYGMSYQEIAQVMDCPENTVKTRMFHARKKLQSILPRLADPTQESTP